MDEFFLTWLAMEQDIQDEQMTALEDYGFDDDDDSDDEFFEFFEGCLDYSMDDEDYDDVQL